jgi:cytochrome c oxidase subunit 1
MTVTREHPGGRRLMVVYLVTGLSLVVLLMLAGLAMRMAQAGWLGLRPDYFYALMTLHGSGMIAALIVCGMGGIWYFVSREAELSLRLGYWAYGLVMGGVVLVLLATLVGRFATGWTFLYPLPFVNPTWPTWSTGAFLVGMVLITLGWSVWCVQVLAALLRRFGGLRGALAWDLVFRREAFSESGREPPPPQMLAATVTSFNGLLAAAASMLIGVPLVVRWLDPAVGLDPLWAKNATYFFGHEFANIIIYMLVAFVYVGLPHYTDRKWRTSRAFVLGWWGTMTFIVVNYSHHLYMDFAQPTALNYLGQVASYLSALPVAVVTVYGGVLLILGSGVRWALSTVFLYGGLAGWILGGVGALLDATIEYNLFFHNTLWVPAHFHGYLLGASFLFALGWAFLLLESRSGQRTSLANRWLVGGSVFGGIALLLASFYVAGAAGVPRRYAVEPEPGPALAALGSVGAILLLAGLGVSAAEAWRLWRAGRPAEEPAPRPDLAPETS